MADYQKMYSLLCRVVDSVIDPLERIPLAAPYADVLRGALEDAEELYVETSSEEEQGRKFSLTRREKHGILMLLQAMMGAAARSRGRKCPPDAPLPAQECGYIQIQVEPRTLFRSP